MTGLHPRHAAHARFSQFEPYKLQPPANVTDAVWVPQCRRVQANQVGADSDAEEQRQPATLLLGLRSCLSLHSGHPSIRRRDVREEIWQLQLTHYAQGRCGVCECDVPLQALNHSSGAEWLARDGHVVCRRMAPSRATGAAVGRRLGHLFFDCCCQLRPSCELHELRQLQVRHAASAE